MRNKPIFYHGNIRLRPLNLGPSLDHRLRDFLNFGEYGELRENVVFHTLGDAYFSELRFRTRLRLGKADEVCYCFTSSDNSTHDPDIYFSLEIKHVFITPEKVFILGESLLSYVEDDDFGCTDESLKLVLNFICEFENKDGIQQAVKKFSKKEYLPVWDDNFKRILSCEWGSTAGTTILGSIRLNYQRTVRYLYCDDRYKHCMLIKTNVPKVEREAHIKMQKSYRDFDLSFQSPARNELEVIHSGHLSKSQSSMMVDENEETGPCMYVEQTILINNYIFIMGQMRLKGRKNDYHYYKFSFKCNSSDTVLEQLCHSFQLHNNDYWNLEEIDIDKFLEHIVN